MVTKVAINGFGRIGRLVFRSILEQNINNIEIVAINDLSNASRLAHLLKYDSIYGTLSNEVNTDSDNLIVDGKKISALRNQDPVSINWKNLGVDVVVEATGKFRSFDKAQLHIHSGAKKVIISAPPALNTWQSRKAIIKGKIKKVFQGKKHSDTDTNHIPVYVMGINDDKYNPDKDHIISNSSCTVNCAAPIIKTIHNKFGIQAGFLTSTHSYSNANSITDSFHGSLRMSRAAGESLISDYHQVGKDVSEIMPELKDKLVGHMFRIPVASVSLLELCLQTQKQANKEEVVNALRTASENDLKGVLGINDEQLVSIDFKKNPLSSIVDIEFVSCLENMVRILSWYDNEWGYACRIIDLINLVTGNKQE